MSHKRRIAAAVLCACFLLRLSCHAISHDGLYFVAVENMVAPLTEETMPFWYDGYLYISSDVFTGLMRDALGISRVKIGDGVLLYRGAQSLLFRNHYPYAQDSQEETYAPGMVWHEVSAYVPASVVARYFNLTYSTVSVRHGKLVWLRNASFKMDDKAFAKAAEFQLNAAYQEYLRSLEPEEEEPPEPLPEVPEADEATAEPDAAETSDAPQAVTPESETAPPEWEAEPVTPETSATAPESAPETTPVTPEETAPAPETTAKPVTPERTQPAPPSDNATTAKPVAPSAPETTPVTPPQPVTPPPAATTAPVTPEETTPAPPPVTQPDPPPSDDAPEPPPEIVGGQQIYLCLRGDDATPALLDALERHNLRAAVFCDEAFLAGQGDLLRRMAATGHRIGLYVGAGETASALERLEAGNEQLRRVTMEKTRLVYADGAEEALLRSIRNAGFLCLRPTLDRARFPLRTSRQAAELLQTVSQQSQTVTLWLGGTVNRSALNAFINAALDVNDAFPTLDEIALR